MRVATIYLSYLTSQQGKNVRKNKLTTMSKTDEDSYKWEISNLKTARLLILDC